LSLSHRDTDFELAIVKLNFFLFVAVGVFYGYLSLVTAYGCVGFFKKIFAGPARFWR